MEYKLAIIKESETVPFLLKSGKDFVSNNMTVTTAQMLLNSGTITASNIPQYPISVNDKWFFAGTISDNNNNNNNNNTNNNNNSNKKNNKTPRQKVN